MQERLLGIDQFDSLRHRVGIFATVRHRFEAQASPVHVRVSRTFFRRLLCKFVREFHGRSSQ